MSNEAPNALARLRAFTKDFEALKYKYGIYRVKVILNDSVEYTVFATGISHKNTDEIIFAISSEIMGKGELIEVEDEG